MSEHKEFSYLYGLLNRLKTHISVYVSLSCLMISIVTFSQGRRQRVRSQVKQFFRVPLLRVDGLKFKTRLTYSGPEPPSGIQGPGNLYRLEPPLLVCMLSVLIRTSRMSLLAIPLFLSAMWKLLKYIKLLKIAKP